MEEGVHSSILPPSTSYDYESLEGQPSDTIRLLGLLPGHIDGGIQGSLITIRLDEKPDYRALSSTWGDATDPEQVYLNGKYMPVRQNLWRFLRRLQLDGQTGYLWADAICVNQQDLSERSAQVQLMSKLYSEAREVYSWLSEDPSREELSPIEQAVLTEGVDLSKTCSRYVSAAEESISMEGMDSSKVSHSSTDTPPGILDPIRDLVKWLGTQPYWNRTWILQVLDVLADWSNSTDIRTRDDAVYL